MALQLEGSVKFPHIVVCNAVQCSGVNSSAELCPAWFLQRSRLVKLGVDRQLFIERQSGSCWPGSPVGCNVREDECSERTCLSDVQLLTMGHNGLY